MVGKKKTCSVECIFRKFLLDQLNPPEIRGVFKQFSWIHRAIFLDSPGDFLGFTEAFFGIFGNQRFKENLGEFKSKFWIHRSIFFFGDLKKNLEITGRFFFPKNGDFKG